MTTAHVAAQKRTHLKGKDGLPLCHRVMATVVFVKSKPTCFACATKARHALTARGKP